MSPVLVSVSNKSMSAAYVSANHRLEKQPSQTLTFCTKPYSGSAIALEEQGWQNVLPQLRQWCLRLVNEKEVRHRWHVSESDHSGGYTEERKQIPPLS